MYLYMHAYVRDCMFCIDFKAERIIEKMMSNKRLFPKIAVLSLNQVIPFFTQLCLPCLAHCLL